MRKQLLLCQAELILLLQFNRYRYTIRQNDARQIRNICRLWDEYLISRIEHGTQCHIDALASADGHENLMHRIIFQLKAALQIMRDLLTQLLQTGIGRIKGPPLFQCVNTFIADMPRGIKVRLTNAKRNDIIHFTYNIKKLPDAGRLNRRYFF